MRKAGEMGALSGEPILPAHGGYRDLRAYRNAEIVHDATVAFCERFLKPTDRTVGQMVQAARSGKQNIIEGSTVSGTSKGLELKLIGVAGASLEELLADYTDFLRQRDLEQWPKEHEKATFIRKLAYRTNLSFDTYPHLRRRKVGGNGRKYGHLSDYADLFPSRSA